MSEDQQIPGQRIFEEDQGYTEEDLKLMIKYNKACEKLCILGFQPQISAKLRQVNIFLEALLMHLKNKKKPSYYAAWDALVQQLPDKWKDIVLQDEE